MRKNIVELIQAMNVDISQEYKKLWELFYNGNSYEDTLYCVINENFTKLHFAGITIDIDEFDKACGFNFLNKRSIKNDEIDYYISFCEYLYNIFVYGNMIDEATYNFDINFWLTHIGKVIDILNYKIINKNNMFIIVEKSPQAIAVSEIVDDQLSISTLEYNHFTMKGDLTRKKETLIKFYNYLEPKRKNLLELDNKLSNLLFEAMNKCNIRHNNVDPGSKNHINIVAEMNNDKLEIIYDDLYQLCLLSILLLDNKGRKNTIEELLKSLKNKNM